MPEEEIRPYYVLLLKRSDVGGAWVNLSGPEIRAYHFKLGMRDINHCDKVLFCDVDGSVYTIKLRSGHVDRPEKILKRPDSFKELGLSIPEKLNMSIYRMAEAAVDEIMAQVQAYAAIYDRNMGDCQTEQQMLKQFILTGEDQYRIERVWEPEPVVYVAQALCINIVHGQRLKIREMIDPLAAKCWMNKKLIIEIYSITTPDGIQRSVTGDVSFHRELAAQDSYQVYVTDLHHNRRDPVVSFIYNEITGELTVFCSEEYRQGRPSMGVGVRLIPDEPIQTGEPK